VRYITEEAEMTDTAKVFWSGRSQAVRLPKDYRFDTDIVTIERQADGIFLRPFPPRHRTLEEQWAWLDDLLPLDDDVIAAAEEEPEPQIRPELDDL
jgi:antitoxin VapB